MTQPNTQYSQTSCTIRDYKVACFDKLTPEQLKVLEDNQVFVEYAKGEVICKQGSFANHAMIVEEGLVKMHLDGNGKSLILKIIPEGNLLGITSISDDRTVFEFSATAYIDSKVRLVNIDTFKWLVKQNAEFAYELIKILSAGMAQINGRFFCLTNKQSYGKLADIILCLTDRIYKARSFELLLSRKELAELSGLSTENVIRILKHFKDEGLITLENKVLTVTNYDKLQEISARG